MLIMYCTLVNLFHVSNPDLSPMQIVSSNLAHSKSGFNVVAKLASQYWYEHLVVQMKYEIHTNRQGYECCGCHHAVDPRAELNNVFAGQAPTSSIICS